MEEEFISLSQAAKLVNKSKGSIGNVIKNGKLEVKRKHNSNQYLIKKSDLLNLFPPLIVSESLPDQSEKIADLEWQLEQEKERTTDLEKELEALKIQYRDLSEQLKIEKANNFNDIQMTHLPTNLNPLTPQEKISHQHIARMIGFIEKSGIVIEDDHQKSFDNLTLLFRFLSNYIHQFRHYRLSEKFSYSMNDNANTNFRFGI